MKKSFLNNNQGSITISFAALLPISIMLVNIFIVIHYFSIQKNVFYKTCLNEFKTVHSEISKSINKLTALNPLAKSLRVKYHITLIALTAALASQNYSLAAKLQTDLQSISRQQKQLDSLQQGIIRHAEIKILTQAHKIHWGALNEMRKYSKIWSSLLDNFYSLHIDYPYKLSLRTIPENELAPEYQLRPSYIRDHQLVLNWQLRILKTQARFNKLSNGQFSETCSLSSKNEDKKWTVVIKRDKH